MTPQDDVALYIQRLPNRLRALVSRLENLGYEFAKPASVLPGPTPSIDGQIRQIESLVGALPQALARCYRTVCSVDLTGSNPVWTGCEYPDPLIVEPIQSTLEEAEEYAELADPKEQYGASESGVFRASIGPDALHKTSVSGGLWYGVEIPNASADPLVLEEPHGLPFTQYWEFALSWGGFPGLENAPGHNWPLADLRRAAGARLTGVQLTGAAVKELLRLFAWRVP